MSSRIMTRRRFSLGLGAGLAGLAGSGGKALAQPRTPVRIGYVPALGAGPLLVAAGAGWAKEAGLDVTLQKLDPGPAAQALSSGALDVVAIGVSPVAVARAKGVDVKVVAATTTGGSTFVASADLAEEFLTTGDNPASAFAAFSVRNGRPARLATLPPGAMPTVALRHWLRVVGKVEPADVEIVQMGAEAIQPALLAGTVDGGTLLEPAATIVLQRNARLNSIVTANEMFTDIPDVVIAATGAFARARGAALERLIGLVVRATGTIVKNPQEAAPHAAAALGNGLVDTAIMASALASPALAYVNDPRAFVEPTRRLFAYQAEIGDFVKAPPTDGLFDPAFYERAEKAGR